MVGRVIYDRDIKQIDTELGLLCGLEILTATLCDPAEQSRRGQRRQLSKLERIFSRAGVSRVILPSQFPTAHPLRRLEAPPPLAFYRRNADLLVLGWLEAASLLPENARVALAGPRLCPELRETALRLSRTVREVRIDVPGREGEEFARELQWRFGLPVLPAAVPADLTTAFGPTEGAAQLRLWEEELCLDGLELTAPDLALPRELGPPLLSLLWERGRVAREQLRCTVNSRETLANRAKE